MQFMSRGFMAPGVEWVVVANVVLLAIVAMI